MVLETWMRFFFLLYDASVIRKLFTPSARPSIASSFLVGPAPNLVSTVTPNSLWRLSPNQ